MKTISIAILNGLFLLGLAGSAFAQNHVNVKNRNAFPAPCETSINCHSGYCFASINIWSFDENGLAIQTGIDVTTVSKSEKQSENRAAAQIFASKRLEQLKNIGVCR